ncbi:maestro heat-like repeat-containing protein family member 2A [Macrochelys suwanniensis]
MEEVTRGTAILDLILTNREELVVNVKVEGVYNAVVSLLDEQDMDVTVLVEKLQKDEQNRVNIYGILEKVLQKDTGGLESRLLKEIIRLASQHMRETQEATNELKVAASNTLVTLARCYFHPVMCELQCHLKPPQRPDEFIFITLGNLASAYALKCIPYLTSILFTMIFMLRLVEDSRMQQAFCGGDAQ